MKKLAIALAALMMAAACVLPASAAKETKTVKVDGTKDASENLISVDAGYSPDGEPGGYFYADADTCVAIKFTFEAGATDVKVNLPVAGTFQIYTTPTFDPATAKDAATREGWTKLVDYTEFLPEGVTEFGMNEEHGWSAAYDTLHSDITIPAATIAACTDNTLYVVICDYSTDDGNGPCIYVPATAVSFAVKYENRRYNLKNNLTADDEGFHAEGTPVDGAAYANFDGMFTMTYTVGSDETEAPAPPTGDSIIAVVAIAAIAGAALVVTKKKLH